MSTRKKRFTAFIIVPMGLLIVVAGAFLFRTPAGQEAAEIVHQAEAESPYREVIVPINDGNTFGDLMTGAGIDYALTTDILAAAEDVYSLTKIRAGKELWLYFDKETDRLIKLIYRRDTEEDLVVAGAEETVVDENGQALTTVSWRAELVAIPYEIKVAERTVKVEEILYVSALENNWDELLVLDLADVFQWSVDFALDVRSGDTAKVIVEDRYLDGNYVMPGKILAAEYVNQGKAYQAFYFETSDGEAGYYDGDGNSVQKFFLKAPVAYKYITSGFTTGRRYISAFNISTGHRAIDYAASSGTPIQATADGTVTFAGWNSQGYGNLTSIRHNETYSTNYAHQSKIIVKSGQKVTQGQTIGYVGSTGLSTGPHLHYEMVKWGTKINPMTEEFPAGDPIPEADRERFVQITTELKPKLESLKVD